MTDSPYYRWLHEAIACDATVITSSRRLARELRNEYGELQIASGREAWPTPNVHYWQDWLRQCLEDLPGSNLPLLIDDSTSVMLWEHCLGRAIRDELLSTSSLVRHAQRAWQRIHEWQLPLTKLAETAASRDEHWFAKAAVKYHDRLHDARWLDSAQLTTFGAGLFADGQFETPPAIVYAGFDQLTPALLGLFSAVREQGCTVTAATERRATGTRRLRSYADSDAMWRAAGNWARLSLDQNSSARIAIIAPDLDTDAVRISRLVREGFAPGWQLAGGHHRSSVDVSYGQPLSNYPAIAVAILILRLTADGLSSSDISVLLRAPFLESDDGAGCSRLEVYLRTLPDRHWQPAPLLEALRSIARDRGGLAWCERMQAVADLFEQRNESRSPDAWARLIDELLAKLGWPASAKLDSAEFQLINRWRQLLNELAQLGGVSSHMTLPEAVRRLSQIAGDTVYQPEVQVGGLRLLGMLEAAGLEFDHLWIGALDASRWPPTSHPLALVNRKLQRELAMPDSTPDDTLAFARRTLDRLHSAASRIELCWSRVEDDKELVPSPLLGVGEETLACDINDPAWHAVNFLGATTQEIGLDNAPIITDDEIISGGAYTVQRMREEPFAALVAGRLHVNELEMFKPGLTPRQRGTIVHDALHHLLREKPTQDELKRWSTAQQEKRIERAAWRALAKLSLHADDVLQRLLQMEKRRLQQLLAAFLEKEAGRDAFAIKAVEYRAVLKQGPVKLDLRIDRLDRLDDGSLLIIDYKAGVRRPFLSSKRKAPAHLQLCVYARALDDAVGGLSLLYIDSREIAYLGDGGSIAWGKTEVDDWSELLEEWCSEVDALLARFSAGDIGINTEQNHDDARPFALLSRVAEFDHVE